MIEENKSDKISDSKLDFSLPGDKPKKPLLNFNAIVLILLTAIIIIQIAALINFNNSDLDETANFSDKDTAIKFENRNLHKTAAEIWKNYLTANKHLDKTEKARVYFRIGNLLMKTGDYDNAIKNFIFSESTEEVGEIKNDINKNIIECFRKSGNASGLTAELSARSSLNKSEAENDNSEVLAEIGSMKITKNELNKKIENMIEIQIKQMSQYTGETLSPEELSKRKEQYLQRIDARQKTQILNEWVQNETLYLEAIERGLNNSPDFEKVLEEFRKNYLSRQVVSEEKNSIKLSEADYKDYFEAHKNDFKQNERVKVLMIKCADKSAVENALKKIKSGADFSETAKQFSIDDSAKNGGKLDYWIEKNKDIPGIGSNINIQNSIFSQKPNEKPANFIEANGVFYLFKIIEKEPERMPKYDEARDRVQTEKRQNKERELFSEYFEKLKTKYKVVIHSNYK
ncbi:MAG TPA: peptidyl-prolyl cis-trans isomerase [bacterium]|nr:peptidyl-prolyl cis-trans isomerase [bacterium]HPN29393.1 peptidyl-prolyl cis-trans isomerase [bacterium]